jgi:hypothetical protein
MFRNPDDLATTKRETLHIASRGAEYHGIFPKARRTQSQTNPQNSLSSTCGNSNRSQIVPQAKANFVLLIECSQRVRGGRCV